MTLHFSALRLLPFLEGAGYWSGREGFCGPGSVGGSYGPAFKGSSARKDGKYGPQLTKWRAEDTRGRSTPPPLISPCDVSRLPPCSVQSQAFFPPGDHLGRSVPKSSLPFHPPAAVQKGNCCPLPSSRPQRKQTII